MQFKSFIDNITIDLQFSKNLASIKNIIRRCIPRVDLPKFTFNTKILSKVIAIGYNKFCSKFCLYTYSTSNEQPKVTFVRKYQTTWNQNALSLSREEQEELACSKNKVKDVSHAGYYDDLSLNPAAPTYAEGS